MDKKPVELQTKPSYSSQEDEVIEIKGNISPDEKAVQQNRDLGI
jgi:hypothetical protein